MPPVLGPVSPSPTRLWSCAATRGATRSPSLSHEERNLVALQAFFEDDPRSGFAHHFPGEHFIRRRQGFFFGLADHHTFARGQAVGFYHQRCAETAKVRA